MSGVWVFENGVFRLIENPQGEEELPRCPGRRAVLIYLPSGEVVSSYSTLQRILVALGWKRYNDGNPELLQFHRELSIDLISLPRDFCKFNSIYMYDIVMKNPNVFKVQCP